MVVIEAIKFALSLLPIACVATVIVWIIWKWIKEEQEKEYESNDMRRYAE